ncbi:uncharacterized protein MELLADRAFT_92538 [Melampsora larici-populina 98AG31]|uniref:Zn(2)-C6 fungal-type domain-containing protein n=1 Tax=Melampsora larici-populina (strain 98AG31 / pathotype 3-4-7) TaxID=747676 RepID=F4S1X0_MELLP|nr:uncharacterized protein MELLADRAFT_92538 [Melampsora larici-populina 98AG31]EGG01368.1 hypothetical protein MELLADRAFT_92538 [Melampsora larici-populina 98AG31]
MYPSIHNYHHHHHPYHLISSYPHPHHHHHHHSRSQFPINLPSIQSLLQEVDGQSLNSNPLSSIDLTLPPLKSFEPNPNLNYLYFPQSDSNQNKINQPLQITNQHHHQILNQHFIEHDSYHQSRSNLNRLSNQLHPNQSNYKLSSKSILNRPKRKQVKRACQNCQKACKGCADSRPCPRCVIHGLTNTCRDAPRKSELSKSPTSSSSTSASGSGSASSSSTSLHSSASSSSSDLSDSSLSHQNKRLYQRPDHHSMENDHYQHISIKCSNVFTNQTTQNIQNIQIHQNHSIQNFSNS